jgi:capsular exopolysaccharide synthesis family protein
MSRIFDALQRSGTEQSGVEYPDMVSVAEVFEAPRDQVLQDNLKSEVIPVVPDPSILVVVADAQASDVSPSQSEPATLPDFPTLQVNVPASSRLVIVAEPDSLAAEKFRFLGVRLRQLRHNRTLKRMLVTSTIPEEGKSLVSANVAGSLARRKEKVLLLEGDLRRPVLAKQFSLGTLAGLGEWLQSSQDTISNIYNLAGPGFWLMPAGSPLENPLELMQSGRLSQLLAQLSNLFDWIIIDSPPLLPLADTTVWSRLTDGTLLVTREGKTQKGALQRGLEILKKSDILGVVLNSYTSLDHNSYYYYSPKDPK